MLGETEREAHKWMKRFEPEHYEEEEKEDEEEEEEEAAAELAAKIRVQE